MRSLEADIKEAQKLMRTGYWDATDDLLEQMLSRVIHLQNQVDELKAQVKQQKMTIKQMDRRIMAGDR